MSAEMYKVIVGMNQISQRMSKMDLCTNNLINAAGMRFSGPLE